MIYAEAVLLTRSVFLKAAFIWKGKICMHFKHMVRVEGQLLPRSPGGVSSACKTCARDKPCKTLPWHESESPPQLIHSLPDSTWSAEAVASFAGWGLFSVRGPKHKHQRSGELRICTSENGQPPVAERCSQWDLSHDTTFLLEWDRSRGTAQVKANGNC